MLKWRLFTAAILIPLVILGIFYLPVMGLRCVMGLILLGCAHEYAILSQFKPTVLIAFMLSLLSLFLFFAFFFDFQDFLPRWSGLGVIFSIWAFWIIYLFLKSKSKSKSNLLGWSSEVGKFLTGISWLLPAFLSMILLLSHFGPWYFLAGLVMVWSADSGAYAAGRLFGKHALAKLISPKKTWEGVLGGALSACCAGWLFYAFVPEIQARSFVTWSFITLLTVCFSVMGDLFESLLKRCADVKDSGQLLPGHGGLLDRLDGVLMAMPVYSLLIS